MAARAAQEALAQLEKDSAAIFDQLEQAALFAGTNLECILDSRSELQIDCGDTDQVQEIVGGHHARREWVLRWLSKKFQAQPECRATPAAWNLLSFLVINLPARAAAKILNERKFVDFLLASIRESLVASRQVDLTTSDHVSSKPQKSSKKRKRDTESTIESAAHNVKPSDASGSQLLYLQAVFQAVNSLSTGSKAKKNGLEIEYVKSVLHTSADTAAKILGAWLDLCSTYLATSSTTSTAYLDVFMDLWDLHVISDGDAAAFADHCLLPSLSLLHSGRTPASWKDRIERLIARNVTVAAKTSYSITDNNTTQTKRLFASTIKQNLAYAPIMFDIAVRSCQNPETKRRSTMDTQWLHAVFQTMIDIVTESASDAQAAVLQQILAICRSHRLTIDLTMLQAVARQFAFPIRTSSGEYTDWPTLYTDWPLVASLLDIDSNFVMIPDTLSALTILEDLLFRITESFVLPTWPDIAFNIADNVVLPLINAFAKARDLTAFFHHWFTQLLETEKLIPRAEHGKDVFSVWEDDALERKLADVVETSLTSEQIMDLIAWLKGKIAESPSAVLVIVSALSTSLCRSETIDIVGMALYNIAFQDIDTIKVSQRSAHFRWRVARNTYRWDAPLISVDDRTAGKQHLLEMLMLPLPSAKLRLEHREKLFLACTLVDSMSDEERCQKSNKHLIETIGSSTTSSLRSICTVGALDPIQKDPGYDTRSVTLRKSEVWLAAACSECVLVLYPRILCILESSHNTGHQILEKALHVASVQDSVDTVQGTGSCLQQYTATFSRFLDGMINDGRVMDEPGLLKLLTATLIECGTKTHLSTTTEAICNDFAIQCLLRLPIEVFDRQQRSKVLHMGIEPATDIDTAAQQLPIRTIPVVSPAVLSLKAKMLSRPAVAQDTLFDDLFTMSRAISGSDADEMLLSALEGYSRATFLNHIIHANVNKKGQWELKLVNEVKIFLKEGLKDTSSAEIGLLCHFRAAFVVLREQHDARVQFHVLTIEKLNEIQAEITEKLLALVQKILQKPKRLLETGNARSRLLLQAIRTLIVFESPILCPAELEKSLDKAMVRLAGINLDLLTVLRVLKLRLLTVSAYDIPEALLSSALKTSMGRRLISKRIQAQVAMEGAESKVTMAEKFMKHALGKEASLASLMACCQILMSSEDPGQIPAVSDTSAMTSLTHMYEELSKPLVGISSFRQFCLVSETMNKMLQEKTYCITQFLVEDTMSIIAAICSNGGPSLPSRRAGTIYLHLCKPVQTLLITQRLRLQGRYHIVVQVMRSLLHCLFSPIPGSRSAEESYPPWLRNATETHQLKATHARVYTRLLTLICDPQASLVSRSSSNGLNSATVKAKRLAGQHMPIVLAAYIKWQLDSGLRMTPDIRDMLTPGIHAIFDAMTLDGRRLLGESMDSSGRALLSSMIREWQRFGKWKGN